jgi:hypothetical protein
MQINRQEDGDLPMLDILGWKIITPCPSGTFLARCVDVDTNDKFKRKKYQSEETEIIPAVRFLFALKDGDNKFLVQTNVYKASGSPKSNFYKAVVAWRGEFPTTFDPNCLKGEEVSLTVEQRTSGRGTVYGAITNISAVPEAYKQACPPSSDFNELMIEAGADIGTLPVQSEDPTLPKETPPPSNPQPKPDTKDDDDSEDVPF